MSGDWERKVADFNAALTGFHFVNVKTAIKAFEAVGRTHEDLARTVQDHANEHEESYVDMNPVEVAYAAILLDAQTRIFDITGIDLDDYDITVESTFEATIYDTGYQENLQEAINGITAGKRQALWHNRICRFLLDKLEIKEVAAN